MADISEVMQGFSALVIDYSALLELNDPSIQDSLITTIIEQNKTVYISRSFKMFHESVVRANNPNEKHVADTIRESLRRLVEAKLLRASKSASNVAFFLEHLKNNDECFLIGRNSNAFARLRNIHAHSQCAIFVFDDGNIRFYQSIQDCMEAEPGYSVNPIAGNTDFVAMDQYFSVGDVVYTDDNERIVLKSLISTGAEGLVFITELDGWVAKVYHRGGITPLRWYKLMKMRDLGLQAENICWPYKLLFSKEHVPIGYLMRQASGTTISRAFDGPDAMQNYFPSWTRLHVVDATLSFLHIMDYLHLHGVIVGDIQLKNAMIEDEDSVYLIDIDSVQYQDLPCPVGTEEFTRPELWDKSFVSFLRRPQDEDYSVSILVFSMLFCGQHPYAQRNGLETLRDEMEARSFPYTVDNSTVDRIPIGGYDKIWEALTPTLKDMFVRAFAKGELFDTVEWTVALTEYRDMLATHKFEDEEYYNVFPYFVEEEEQPKKRVGKMSVREAVMSSAMNSSDMAESYSRQVPISKPAPEPKAERHEANPAFKGSTSAPSSSAFKAPSGAPSSASLVGERALGNRAASQRGNVSNSQPVYQNEGFLSFFKRNKVSLIFVVLFIIGIVVLALLTSR